MENGKGSFFWVEETNGQTLFPMKQQRRRVKTNKPEFVGWCSKPLFEFLESIGKDTTIEHSQYDVTAIINNYVNTHNLINPVRKKKVDCDERLRSLFIKKTIPRNKIHELLNPHFAKNHDSSDDDDSYSSEEYDDDYKIATKKQKIFSLEKNAPTQKKKTSETHLSIYAAVIPENIKLLYLKRSLVQEFLKHSESFQGKMVGSYIRIKSDPNDFSQKNSHQLHPVTGIKNVHVNGVIHEVLLQVPNMLKDLPICMLSDEDFSKEECEDLCQRVKDGLLKRPTVVEVEQKAQVLHEDIIKHWIPRELIHLQNLIDRANEKGWRKEPLLSPALTLFDYLERKKLLQTPSEVSKLLADVPNVTADKLDSEPTPQKQEQDTEELYCAPVTTHKDVSHPTFDVSEHESPVLVEVKEGKTGPMENGGSGGHLTSLQWVIAEQVPKTRNSGQKAVLNASANVIELSDDEEETQKQSDQEKTQKQDDEYDFSCKKWFYRDPQGQIQGPVSRNELKVWSDAGYFFPNFKVWKDGQTPDDAILLKDMLSGNCSKC